MLCNRNRILSSSNRTPFSEFHSLVCFNIKEPYFDIVLSDYGSCLLITICKTMFIPCMDLPLEFLSLPRCKLHITLPHVLLIWNTASFVNTAVNDIHLTEFLVSHGISPDFICCMSLRVEWNGCSINQESSSSQTQSSTSIL